MHSRRQTRQKVWKSAEASLEGRLDATDGSVAIDVWERPEASRWANAMMKGLSASVEHICTRSEPLALGPDPCNTQTTAPIKVHDTVMTVQKQKTTLQNTKGLQIWQISPAHLVWETQPAKHFQGCLIWYSSRANHCAQDWAERPHAICCM